MDVMISPLSEIQQIYLTLERSSLLGLLGGDGLGTLIKLGLGLQSHNSTTPLTGEIGILVELLHTQILEDLELRFILLVNLGKSNNGGCLLVDESSKTGLILNNKEGDLHLTAEGGKPKDELEGVNIACDKDERSLLLLNEGGNMLQSEFQLAGNLGGCLLPGGGGGGSVLNTLLLGGGSLGTVLVQQVENTSSLILSNRLGELVDGRGDLKTLVKDGTLTLDAHILGPANEAAQITSGGADGSSDAGGTRAGGEEGVSLGWGLLDWGGFALAAGLLCHGGCWFVERFYGKFVWRVKMFSESSQIYFVRRNKYTWNVENNSKR